MNCITWSLKILDSSRAFHTWLSVFEKRRRSKMFHLKKKKRRKKKLVNEEVDDKNRKQIKIKCTLIIVCLLFMYM